ncbi:MULTISPECIES: hypothetical protein [unclassified Bacillus (in: firmicutes)]|uniref:hypothetical protein n=1 Tax=unclassified Bacillus (in: firmicutes) TaxID=185979 RepID=UPI0015CF78F1|nr:MULTISPECIES: hypothetical protein [unclassified Bacillus (in: firmicutes)]
MSAKKITDLMSLEEAREYTKHRNKINSARNKKEAEVHFLKAKSLLEKINEKKQ